VFRKIGPWTGAGHGAVVVEVPVLGLVRVPAVGRVVAAAEGAGMVGDAVLSSAEILSISSGQNLRIKCSLQLGLSLI
jgi:hypothetical protein